MKGTEKKKVNKRGRGCGERERERQREKAKSDVCMAECVFFDDVNRLYIGDSNFFLIITMFALSCFSSDIASKMRLALSSL